MCSIIGTHLLKESWVTLYPYYTLLLGLYPSPISQMYLVNSILKYHLEHYALRSLCLEQVCPKSLFYWFLQIFVSVLTVVENLCWVAFWFLVIDTNSKVKQIFAIRVTLTYFSYVHKLLVNIDYKTSGGEKNTMVP